MDEPTKDPKEETTDDGTADNGDMMTALEKLREEDEGDKPKEEPTKEEPTQKEPTKDNEDDEDLKLDDLKDGDDIAAWKEQKEKGIQKLVERQKRKEAELDERLKDIDGYRADAEYLRQNQGTILGVIDWVQRAKDPETREAALAEMRAKLGGEEFEPEHESEKKLAGHIERVMSARIAELESKMEAATRPLLTEKEQRDRELSVKKKAEDAYEETALAIASTCNGYKVEKEGLTKAMLAYPDMDPEDAVRKHLFSDILAHTAEAATKTVKKREIVDSSTKKEVQPPESSDMMEHLEYLRQTARA